MKRLLLAFLLLGSGAVAKQADDLPVLCYHQVAPRKMGNDMVISAPAPGKYVQLVRINWSNVTSIGRPG